MFSRNAVLRLICLVLIVLVAQASSNATPLFQLPRHCYSYGRWPLGISMGDVNGDGKPDLLVADACASGGRDCHGGVAVLLGNGKGGFRFGGENYSGGDMARSIALGDVNGDGKLDILVANDTAVGVLLGNGDGTFQPAQSYGSGGQAISVGDVNRDGKLDLLVTNGRTLEMLLGNGDGTFQPSQTLGTGGDAIAIGDVDGDGQLDLLVSDSGSVRVLLGNGDGSFQAERGYVPGGHGIAVSDVNGDGKLDLLVVNREANTVSVLLGNGDGTFQPAQTYASGGYDAISVAVADLNADGKPDLAVLNTYEDYQGAPSVVGILLGNGDGTFQAAENYRTGGLFAWAMTVGDINGDNMPDLLVVNACADRNCLGGVMGVLLNTTKGFVTTTALRVDTNPSVYGQMIALTATVRSVGPNPPTGGVSFREGANLLGSAKLNNGVATLMRKSLPAGTLWLTATYSGNAQSLSSTSTPLGQVVTRATTTTTIKSSVNPSAGGQLVMFTAIVTSPTAKATGTVTFTVGAVNLGTAALNLGGKAIIATSGLPLGSNTISATYDGNDNIIGSAASMIQIVNK